MTKKRRTQTDEQSGGVVHVPPPDILVAKSIEDVTVPAAESDAPDLLVLGLDLATTTGYAFAYVDLHNPTQLTYPAAIGCIDFSPGQYETAAMRVLKLMDFLEASSPGMVIVEKGPLGQRGLATVEVQIAMHTTMQIWCERNNVPLQVVLPSLIKKRAAGKGNASKESVVDAANREFGMSLVRDDGNNQDAADALYALVLGLESYGNGLVAMSHGVFYAGRDDEQTRAKDSRQKRLSKRKKRKT